jgi:hypothetical protein
MRSALSGWEVELAQWLRPFVDRLGHKARRPLLQVFKDAERHGAIKGTAS